MGSQGNYKKEEKQRTRNKYRVKDGEIVRSKMRKAEGNTHRKMKL